MFGLLAKINISPECSWHFDFHWQENMHLNQSCCFQHFISLFFRAIKVSFWLDARVSVSFTAFVVSKRLMLISIKAWLLWQVAAVSCILFTSPTKPFVAALLVINQHNLSIGRLSYTDTTSDRAAAPLTSAATTAFYVVSAVTSSLYVSSSAVVWLYAAVDAFQDCYRYITLLFWGLENSQVWLLSVFIVSEILILKSIWKNWYI